MSRTARLSRVGTFQTGFWRTLCLVVSKPSVSNRASGSTRLGHDMRQYRSFLQNEPLTFRVEAPPRSPSILGSTQKDAKVTCALGGWLSMCARRGRFRCVAGCLGVVVLLSRLVAWLCRSGLCPLRSVSSFSEKGATTQGTICRAASPELPFSCIPAIVIPDGQVASGGLFFLGHY